MSKDRQDGIYLKPKDSIHAIMPHIMKNRCEAEVYVNEIIDVTDLVKYLEKINKNREVKITFFHAMTTALAKMLYNREKLNFFVAGKRYYKRNKITLSFVAKNKLVDNADERLLILDAKKDMNIYKISDKVQEEVSKVRKAGSNSIEDALNFVTNLPRPILSFIFGVYRRLDYHGLTPKSLWQTDPNYSTLMMSNLGSVKCNSCYHHLNNYGTNSIIITIGKLAKENYIDEDKKIKTRTTINIGATLDERIADGFYFAKSLNMLKYILSNPNLLEDDLNTKIDIGEK